MKVELDKFCYNYMEYEKELQKLEIISLIPESYIISESPRKTIIECKFCDIEKLECLTYYKSFSFENGEGKYTRQGLLEAQGAELAARQNTRYSTHGLHEYKGKFNPQIVKAIINIFEVNKNKIVFDPFCGSGTTLLECIHAGIQGYGTDINPLASYITNTKINSLFIDIPEAKYTLEMLVNSIPVDIPSKDKDDERIEYLKKWIPFSTLCILENIKEKLKYADKKNRNLFLSIASDLIREYSYQEPADLRIRRRKTPLPEQEFIEAFYEKSKKILKKIEYTQCVLGDIALHGYAKTSDIRKDCPFEDIKFDAAITSPPYVSALPYIDTQRISLVWLGLCAASDIRQLESTLIGDRELLKSSQKKWSSIIGSNAGGIPADIHKLVLDMEASISKTDGFRKQAVPTLVYKYFFEMKSMFKNIKALLKKNAPYGLVVGHNKTKLGNVDYLIDTPTLLALVAQSCGWKIEEIFPLQTYKRYGIHSKNSIDKESLILLRNTMEG